MRYQIFNGSASAHCCFDATVMDTTKPKIIGGEHYTDIDGQLHYDTVCECFSMEDAQLICDALNAADASSALAEIRALNDEQEQQSAPDVKRDDDYQAWYEEAIVASDDYRAWYEEAIVASNEAGFVGMSAAQVIVYQDGEIMRLRAEVEALVEALELAQGFLRNKGHSEEDPFLLGAINAALAPYRKGGGE